MTSKKSVNREKTKKTGSSGKLRIGDNWNAITIIALSQSNPLKAIAEFVENSIDAEASKITIIRGKEQGDHYLKIVDDGDGIRSDENGVPDFKYVATHICDSIKKQLKKEGASGIQGEFGIGLLSFWTVGEELKMVSSGDDGKTYQMTMAKGEPRYTISPKRLLVPIKGTELTISRLLAGVRHINGEKMQRYLASELRDRIRRSEVKVNIIDRTARKEYCVEPREFAGRLLHQLPAVTLEKGEIYIEIYLNEASSANKVGLYRSGTRVLNSLTELDNFQDEPWKSGWLEGIIDVPFLNLTPGTRSGIIYDENYYQLCAAVKPLEEKLNEIIAEQRRAEEERASKKILKKVQSALKEAILSLPKEEYDWFNIHTEGAGNRKSVTSESTDVGDEPGDEAINAPSENESLQKAFFEFAGPLFSVRISPASSVVSVGKSKNFRAVPRDKNRKLIDSGISFSWEVTEGDGLLQSSDTEIVTFNAPEEPGLTRLTLSVTQNDITCTAEGLVTITDTILPKHDDKGASRKGLPGYTFRRAPGELWRSRYDERQNVIVINNGHRDFVYASKTNARKLRYICRLFAKELVLMNFPGLPPDQLIERMIELGLYTEEHLK